MKIGMPNVVMRYPRRLTVVRNSKVATVFVLRQRLTFGLAHDVQKNVLHAREQRLEAVNLDARANEGSKQIGRRAASLSGNQPLTIRGLHGSRCLRDRGQRAVYPHADFRPRMLPSHVVHTAVDYEPSAMDERDAIAERFGVPHLMRGEHRRTAGL